MGLPRGFSDFLVRWVCGHLEECLYREYGVPARLGIMDWVEVEARILERPRGGHHLSVAGYRGRDPSSMVMDRIGFDFDATPETLDRALDDALELLYYIRKEYGATGALQFTGRRGYRVWVFLKQPLEPSVFPALVRALVRPLRLETLELGASTDVRHLFRVPYTLHEKTGKAAPFLDPETLKPIPPGEWSYDPYEPLDPSQVRVIRVVVDLPKPIVVRSGKQPKAYRYIEQVLEKGLPDGRKRFILYCLAPYLANIRRLPDHEALATIRGFLERCEKRPDFHGQGKVYESWIRAAYRGAKDKGILPARLETLKQRHPELHALITQTLAEKPSKTKAPRPGLPDLLEAFLEETGLTEFTYDDFKRWLEAKKGPLSAEEWSSYSRILRMLAQKGLLGRKFLVNGQWIDVGPGRVEEPPSRNVRFYVVVLSRLHGNS